MCDHGRLRPSAESARCVWKSCCISHCSSSQLCTCRGALGCSPTSAAPNRAAVNEGARGLVETAFHVSGVALPAHTVTHLNS